MHLGWEYLRHGILKVAAKRYLPHVVTVTVLVLGIKRLL